ncbi:MAG: Hpt domain-containing protein, partial [Bacteroidetes bacterium]|nr:Hpt domain-containing protein [Bacteroidota bacterium]
MELSKDELKEMMSIFKVESEEHLKNLNKCLLKLEESPKSKELLEELFRTAHSIKGSARMMGFGKIESVSHKIEDIFGLLRNAKIALTAEEFDLIYEGVDVISQIIEKMSEDGSDESIDVQSICTRLEKMAEAKSGVKSTGKGKQKAEPKTDGETEESMDEDSVMDAILDQ